MESRVRIRLNLKEREIELEGDSAFVQEYFEPLKALIMNLPAQHRQQNSSSRGGDLREPGSAESFGEFLHQFPASISDTDLLLVGASFVQSQNADNTFSTGDVANVLREQGHNLANPSSYLKRHSESRRVFAVSRGRYRISAVGREYVKSLIE